MNANGGKGYFYKLGVLERNTLKNTSAPDSYCPFRKPWPRWAQNAYIEGFYGRCCP